MRKIDIFSSEHTDIWYKKMQFLGHMSYKDNGKMKKTKSKSKREMSTRIKDEGYDNNYKLFLPHGAGDNTSKFSHFLEENAYFLNLEKEGRRIEALEQRNDGDVKAFLLAIHHPKLSDLSLSFKEFEGNIAGKACVNSYSILPLQAKIHKNV